MLRLRIVLDFVADEASPCAEAELRGYLKAMVLYQSLGVGLGSRNLESLGFAGVRLIEAAFEEAPSAEERVATAGQRVEACGLGASEVRRVGAGEETTDTEGRNDDHRKGVPTT